MARVLILRMVMILFFLSLSISGAVGQINKVWDTVGDGYWDLILQSDQLGNCYVHHVKFGSQIDSLMLTKYNSKGIKLWDKLVYSDTSSTTSLSFGDFYIDSLNCPIIQYVVVDDVSDNDYLLKCDTAGNFMWTIPMIAKNARCVFDSNGNIYFSGSSMGQMNLWKYDSIGTLQYVASRPFTSGSYGPLPMIDNLGNALFVFRDSIQKVFKVDLLGSIIDSLFLIETTHGFKLDTHNNLLIDYFVNYPGTPSLDSTKSGIKKYDDSLNFVWDSGLLTFGQTLSLLVDYSNNIYIISLLPIYNTDPKEYKIAKMSPNGSLLWVNNFGNTMGLTRFYNMAVFINPDNFPILMGQFYPTGYISPTTTPTDKLFIIKLDTTGVILEQEEIVGLANLQGVTYPKMNGFDLQIMVKYSSLIQYHIFDYCTNCPTTLSGSVYFDADSSCVMDSLELGLKNAIVEISPGGNYVVTDSTGYYHAYLPDSTYSISSAPYLNFSNTCAVSPASITISNGTPVQNLNFGKFIDPLFNDLSIDVGRGQIRPGFNTLFVINYQNNGGSIQSGTIDFVPESFFTFVQASETPTFPGGDTIRWSFSNLLFGESRTISITLNTPVSVGIGTMFTNETMITTTLPDNNPGDNFVIDQGNVTGSFDPNDKTVIPVGVGSQGFISTADSILHYTINFENYGNDTAFTVTVIDTIDQDLDVSSLRIGAVSHSYKLDILHSKILRFRFNNIMLADSSNPNENYGFINYFIKQKPGLSDGTQLHNSAEIYFDYNLPITTAPTINTILEPTGLNDIIQEEGFLFYPNPVRDKFTIELKEKASVFNVYIYDIKGELNYFTESNNGNQKIIDMSSFIQGIYILKIETDKNSYFKKIVKLL